MGLMDGIWNQKKVKPPAMQALGEPMWPSAMGRMAGMQNKLLYQQEMEERMRELHLTERGYQDMYMQEMLIRQQQEAEEQAKRDAYNPNDDPGLIPTLSEAANLWLARFGDVWVKDTALDEFTRTLRDRLYDNGRMERHNAYGVYWYRLQEVK
jgi:hypothetical protein